MADDDIREGGPERKKRKPTPPPDDDDVDEDEDEAPRRRKIRRDADEDDSGGVTNVIPYKNGMALAAYYCGVFGLAFCFLGPLALIFGIMGLMKAAKDDQARGRVHAWIGIVLGSLELLACCGVGGFAGVGIFMDKGGRR